MTNEPIQGRSAAERLANENAAWILFRWAVVGIFAGVMFYWCSDVFAQSAGSIGRTISMSI